MSMVWNSLHSASQVQSIARNNSKVRIRKMQLDAEQGMKGEHLVLAATTSTMRDIEVCYSNL